MRKAIVVFMAFTMFFTLFGCAGNNRESNTDLSVTMYGEKVNSSEEIKLEAGHTLGESSYYVSVTTKKGAGLERKRE